MPRLGRLLVLLLVAQVCAADNVTFLRIDRSVIEQHLQRAPLTPAERLRTLRSLFEKAGFASAQIEEQPVPGEKVPNLLCTLRGDEYGTILVGAALDYEADGDLQTVDWASLLMLPLLAESLNAAPHRHTLIFAAFTGSAHNFAGSSFYLQHLTEAERKNIRGMVDIAEVGRSAPVYGIPSHETAMTRLLPLAARALHLPDMPSGVDTLATTEAATFERAHIPALIISSLSFEVVTKDETRAAGPSTVLPNPLHEAGTAVSPGYVMRTRLDPEVYNGTYNLLCVYVLFLDRCLSAGKRPATAVLQAKTAMPAPPPASQGPPSSSGQVGSESGTAVAAAVTQVAAGSGSTLTATSSGGVAIGVTDTSRSNPGNASSPEVPPAVLPASLPTLSMQPENAGAPVVFRVDTRLVQVDVIAEDKHGKPIENLRASDFTVLDNGVPQPMRGFEVHRGETAAAAAKSTGAASKQSPTTYSNIPDANGTTAWTIVLFDLLNTATVDQSFARTQLLQVLRAIPHGQPVALFVLTKHLEVLQEFTQDPDELIKRAELLSPARSQLLTTTTEKVQSLGQVQQAANMAAPASGPFVPANAVASFTADLVSRINQGMQDHETFRTDERVRFTLAAMAGLSRAVSGYPGRKNVIWLSGSFPIASFGDASLQDPGRNDRNYAPEMRATAALLAESRIAVYPVDVRGLQSTGIDISLANRETALAADPLASPSQGATGASSSTLGNTLTTQMGAMADERFTMNQLARETGGEAFTNTNDLRRAVIRSLENGSNYYTLAYTPPKDEATATYHRIEVRLNRPDTRLHYRTGYYLIPHPAEPQQAGAATLRDALQPGMPQSTMVLFTASIQAPDSHPSPLHIAYNIRPESASFRDEANQRKRALYDCMVIAFDGQGHEMGHASDTLDATVPLSSYEAILAKGLPANQELSLPPGIYDVRIGVLDRTTLKVGTVDIPFVVESQPPLKSSTAQR